jgi:Flp pilus assembly protein TadD
MEIAPPSLLILTPLAIVYLLQTVRLGNLSMATKQLVGGGSLNHWTHLFFIPVVVAALNAQAFPALDQLIFWTRTHFLAVTVCMLVVAEVFLRGAVINGISRLARTVENSRSVKELQAATDALVVLGLYDMGIVGLNRIAEIAPESSRNHSHLASLYGIQRRFVRAEEAARRAVTIDPNNKFGHYYLGMAVHELGRTDEAAKCFEKARELGLTMPDTYFPKNPSDSQEHP